MGRKPASVRARASGVSNTGSPSAFSTARLALHNLGPERVEVRVELGEDTPAGRLAEVLADQHYEPAEDGRPLALDGFGYRWLRLSG